LDDRALDSVEISPYLHNDAYDDLLSENLVFLHLYDSSANNALIECIARGTPVLVNPLPAVIEYLGAEYPLYFDTLEEAAAKAEDDQLVTDAHHYLSSDSLRGKLAGKYFVRSFVESEIYRSLPELTLSHGYALNGR